MHIEITLFGCDNIFREYLTSLESSYYYSSNRTDLCMYTNQSSVGITIQNGLLKEHLRKHTEEKSNVCSKYDKFVLNDCNEIEHMLIHTGDDPYQCCQCEKAILHCIHFIGHLMIHTGEKAYQCNQCEKCLHQSNIFTGHMRMYTGNLVGHLGIHTGEIPYRCSHCEIDFLQIP